MENSEEDLAQKAQMDLIKIVRGLDQNGAGENGSNLMILWNSLTGVTASSDNVFHAAEESTLRWLLKSMNGSSEANETIRRFPLTWAILDCVLQRIPLFSLAKSLADRKFITVLQQTFKDISQPTTTAEAKLSTKRKRSETIPYTLEAMKSPTSCIATASVVFATLKSLLDRLDDAATITSRDRVGSEHIKSLFCNSASESIPIISPAISMCQMLLDSDSFDVEGCESWIETLAALWDLHLQASDDAIEFATHLFTGAAVLLSKVEDLAVGSLTSLPTQIRLKWSADLQSFLKRNLVGPAKAAFSGRDNFESMARALDVSKGRIDATGPALYFLVASSAGEGNAKEHRKHGVEWLKRVFQAVEQSIRNHEDRGAILGNLLRQAIRSSAPIDVKDLRQICQTYAPASTSTDWTILANVGECDSSVFQPSGDGGELLDQICKRSRTISPQDLDSAASESIYQVILAIRQSYITRRDLSGFLKLWYTQLCHIESEALNISPWSKVDLQNSDKALSVTLVEKEMTALQLVQFIQWLEEQDTISHPQATSILLNAVTQGIRRESITDGLGARIFHLIWKSCKKTDKTPLKWRVVRRAISWAEPQMRGSLWEEIKEPITKILSKKRLNKMETFESFKCAYLIWDCMGSDHDLVDELASVISDFSVRLGEDSSSLDAEELGDLSLLQKDIDAPFVPESAGSNYLKWYLTGCSRFLRLYTMKNGTIVPLVQSWLSKQDTPKAIWHALLENDVNLNGAQVARALVDQLINVLEKSGKDDLWPQGTGAMCMQALSRVPMDNLNRWQREHTMELLSKLTTKILKKPEAITGVNWKSIFSLITKLMSRPTYFEDLKIAWLYDVADALSISLEKRWSSQEETMELIKRFSIMSSTFSKQMTENIDDRSLKYFAECRSTLAKGAVTQGQSLRIIVVKSIFAELQASAAARSNSDLVDLQKEAQVVVAEAVLAVFRSFMDDKKSLDEQTPKIQVQLFAAADGASVLGDLSEAYSSILVSARKLEKRSFEKMQAGDIVASEIQMLIRNHLPKAVKNVRPTQFGSLEVLPTRLGRQMLSQFTSSIVKHMSMEEKAQYLQDIVSEYASGHRTNGQALAVYQVVNRIVDVSEQTEKQENLGISAAYGEIISVLPKSSAVNSTELCRSLVLLLERKAHAISQWDVEITLSTICDLCVEDQVNDESVTTSYVWLCKLVEIIIKKHRLRLEGHYHLILTTVQNLLRCLIVQQTQRDVLDGVSIEAKAHAFAKLITLICEPTVGAVSRSQHQSSLDSATDAAKRTAGRHMYLVLMQYVKHQLEQDVPNSIIQALEPAMNSIFNITSPEGRKILNDAMDGSGRTMLREMYKRYQKFGKWTGV